MIYCLFTGASVVKVLFLLIKRFLFDNNSTVYVSKVPDVTWCMYFIFFCSVFHISIYVLNTGLRLFKPCLLVYILWRFGVDVLN
jgi:hypothetical protein